MMKNSGGRRGCLSQESLGDLAIRIAQGAGDPGAPGEGSPDFLSVDLFTPDEEQMRQHIKSCTICQKRLLEEVYSIRRYLEGLENPENIKRFDELMDRNKNHDSAEESQYEIVEIYLSFDAYGQGEGGVALAAASDSKDQLPLRFTSEDGSTILREFIDTSTGQSSYRLFTDSPGLARNAEVFVGDQSFKPDQEGMLDFEDLQTEITRNTKFKVRSIRS